METFGDPDVARALKSELGVAELHRLRALMSGYRVCAAHPSTDHAAEQCPCRSSASDRRHLDVLEQRQRERDDRDSGLSVEQREALLAGLAAMFAAGAKAKLSSGGDA